MKKLVIISIIAALSFFGYYEFSKYQQQQLEQVQAQQQFKDEERTLEAAVESENLNALNQFIVDYPNSSWRKKAIYQRDRLVYQQASETNSTQELDNFINNYPDSQWLEQAKMKQQRLLREQKQEADRQRRQAEIEAQREQFKQQATQRTPPTNSTTQTTEQKKSTSGNSQDRVARALAIYQKQRQQEQKIVNQKQQQAAQLNKTRQRCLSLKDQIKQYDRKRVRWYDLDENGERVYIPQKQVKETQKRLQKQYQEHCL